ncbi:glycosyltransferase family 4 protein [Polaribacter sp. BAL334]|uniref:glycosyltransferase family 4 protein n=1 Tax=Polaribacter sp. BAL334 TaxID=1708178 RepID=UPI0018D1FBF1|nr:glycosyltransferase family 4 protein [Polaribacter sp. BAL334]MBG7611385.1 glycosyltransferase family 4 protein [Polaribacter sp. BAL334]
MKPILIHIHFHHRKTGVTRSIENVLPFFSTNFETYVYGNTIDGNFIKTSKFIKLLFSDRKIVVHCHRNNEIIRMLFFRFLGAKFRLIATRHSATKPSKMTSFLLKKADKVITLIPSMSQDLGIKNDLVFHGVNVEEFVPNHSKSISEIAQKNIILCAGRVRKAKGQLILLEAASIVKNHQDWALVIVGKVDKPEFLTELKAISQKHSIENQVYFIDETREIIGYYQAAKIAVVPSFSEGFSLVTAEAMSCECTVIATKNVGVHDDLISHEKNGYLFEAGKSDELAIILQRLISKEIPFLGKEARIEILKNWSAEKEANELMKMYQSN